MDIKWLDPKIDYVLKRILCRSQKALCSMTNAVLQLDSPIEQATVLNPEISPEAFKGKQIRLDVLARLQNKAQINVEFQTRLHAAFSDRLLYYWARVYSQGMVEGDNYSTLAPTYVIAWTRNIVDRETPFHSIYEARERRSSRLLSSHFQIHLLELAKLDHPNLEIDPLLLLWAQFLATSNPQRYTELAEQDPGIKEAVNILQELSQDPKAQADARAREDELRLYHYDLRVAGQRGEARGEARGIELGEAKTLRRQLAQRFGELPDPVLGRIEAASGEELELWLSRVIEAERLEDVFLAHA